MTLKKKLKSKNIAGKCKRAIPVHEKYGARPVALKNICLAQFATSYDTMPVKSGSFLMVSMV